MYKAIFVSATDTNVGKTFYSAQIANEFSDRYPDKKIAYLKPTQCGKAPNFDTGELETDMDVIKNLCPQVEIYNSFFFEYPAAPAIAAALEQEGAYIDINKIVNDFESLKSNYDLIIVEGAGGLAVPINMNFLVSDLVKLLDIPLLIVTRPDLGTINHSVMSVEHAKNKGLNVLGLMMTNVSKEVKNASKVQGRAYHVSKNKNIDFSTFDFADESLPIHIQTAPKVISSVAHANVYVDVRDFIDDFAGLVNVE